jgi:sugar O-acyltransferase (sialic acid O-acetyltransferase NeuD family)
MKKIPKNIILYGGTGQAKIVKPIIEFYKSKVVAVFDDTPNLDPPFDKVSLFYGFEGLLKWTKKNDIKDIGFLITIGNPHGNIRLKLHNKLLELGYSAVTIIDPKAIIAKNAKLGEGTQVMAGANIMPEVVIGKQCIINSNSCIEHECIIEDGCEIAPSATLCGCVQMKKNSWVCAGATILPRVTIGENSIVGAGAVVLSDIEPNKKVVGIPAKKFL